MFCCFGKKYILVVSNVGQANEQRLKILLEEVYKIQGKGYQRNEDEYESEKYFFKIYLNTDGENLDKNEIMENKSKIKAIICLENLNPRSNSLKDNLDQLRQVFTTDELWKKLYVFFSFGTSTKPSSLKKLREDVLDFNEMYKLIGLFDRISASPGLFSFYFNYETGVIIRRSSLNSRDQNVQILKKEFNSKHVWSLARGSESTLRKIKF
jgi:hypothetical protein